MNENEDLRDHMKQIEKDTIDVVSFLKKQDLEKDTDVNNFVCLKNNDLKLLFLVLFRLQDSNKNLKIFVFFI
jgi:hypothetical protein